MNRRVRMDVDWAFSSKRPGDQNYRVLWANGGPDRYTYFGEAIGCINPGVPDRRRKREDPGQPPWVSFIGLRFKSGEQYGFVVGMSIVEYGVGRDSGNRTITHTRFFLFPTQGRRFPYRAMWQAARDVALSENLRGALELLVEEGTEPRVRYPATGPLNFRWAAGVAAAMLDRPVVVHGRPGTDPDRALADLEAILALLPYGYRTTVRIGTWTANSQIVTDLAFGDRGLGNSTRYWEVPWGTDVAVPIEELSDTARDYFRHLTDLHAEYDHRADSIADGLAAADTPHTLGDDPGWAVEVVRQLNLPFSVFRRITANGLLRTRGSALAPEIADPATLESVLAVTRFSAPDTFHDERRTAFLNYLLLHSDPHALAGTPEIWWEAAVVWLSEIVRDAEDSAQQAAEGGHFDIFVRRFVEAAGMLRGTDLASAVHRVDWLWRVLFTAAAQQRAAIQPIVDLWSRWPERSTAVLSSSIEVLAATGELVRALLFTSQESVEDARVLLRRLLSVPRAGEAWYAPLRIALAGPEYPLSIADVDRFDRFMQEDLANLALLLWLALDGPVVNVVLARAGWLLVDRAAQVLREGGSAHGALIAFAKRPLPPGTRDASRVVVDYARLLLDLPDDTSLSSDGATDGYLVALADFLRDGPTADLDAEYAQRLVLMVLTAPTIPRWADPLFRCVLTSASARAQRTLVDAIANYIADPVHGYLIVSDLAFTPVFWGLLHERASDQQVHLIRAPLISGLAHSARWDAPSEDLAQSAANAAAAGCSLGEVLGALRRWPHCEEPARALGLLERLAYHTQTPPEVLPDHVLLGVWGPLAAQRCLEHLVQALKEGERIESEKAQSATEAASAVVADAKRSRELFNQWKKEEKSAIDEQKRKAEAAAKRAMEMAVKTAEAAHGKALAEMNAAVDKNTHLWREAEKDAQAALGTAKHRLEAVRDGNLREIERMKILLERGRAQASSAPTRTQPPPRLAGADLGAVGGAAWSGGSGGQGGPVDQGGHVGTLSREPEPLPAHVPAPVAAVSPTAPAPVGAGHDQPPALVSNPHGWLSPPVPTDGQGMPGESKRRRRPIRSYLGFGHSDEAENQRPDNEA